MKIIEREDFAIIREFAKKYNMNVADFGRCIVRQSERCVGRAVRLSSREYDYIKKKAEKNHLTISRFCALACHVYLEENNKEIPQENSKEKTNRTHRIEVRIYNNSDEDRLIVIANNYSMKLSALIRYCALNFDGNKIITKGE